MAHDILIKGGTVFDGTGKEGILADIAIKDGHITEIAHSISETAATTINAADKFVAPGFIDITNHADTNGSLFTNPNQEFLTSQGITTILTGNCGTSAAPIISGAAIEGFRKWRGVENMAINWGTTREYIEELKKQKLGPNVALLAGHGTLRRGLTKGEARRLTKDELQSARQSVEQSISEGAFGISFGLPYAHEATASTTEITELAESTAKAGGIVKVHLRNEGTRLIPAVNEMIQVAKNSGARIIISHFKAVGKKSWPLLEKTIAIIERARKEGTMIGFDVSPYERTGSFLYLLLPVWARDGGFEKMLTRIKNKEERERMLADLKTLTPRYNRLTVASAAVPGTAGKTILELADTAREDPGETLLNILVASDGRATVFGRVLSRANVDFLIRHPASAIATDGTGVPEGGEKSEDLIHPRSTGAFPHFLHRTTEGKAMLTWPEAIKKITGIPREMINLENRGVLAKGYAADIVLFDPKTIHDTSTYAKPFAKSVGIEAVIVNGKIIIKEGKPTNVTGGRVLTKTAHEHNTSHLRR